MLKLSRTIVAASLLVLASASAALAEPASLPRSPADHAAPPIAPQLTGVPFQATQVILRRGPAGVVETHGRIARSSDGSTFVELVDAATGTPSEALIFDVPNRRQLVLDLRQRRYRVLAAPALQGREVSLQAAADQLRLAAAEKNASVHQVNSGMDVTWTSLGTRRVEGLEAVGSVKVRRPLASPGEAIDGPAEVDESWISVDLGIAVLRTRHDPLSGEDTQLTLTGILRSEPDPSLFRVPANYLRDDGSATLVRPSIR